MAGGGGGKLAVTSGPNDRKKRRFQKQSGWKTLTFCFCQAMPSYPVQKLSIIPNGLCILKSQEKKARNLVCFVETRAVCSRQEPSQGPRVLHITDKDSSALLSRSLKS